MFSFILWAIAPLTLPPVIRIFLSGWVRNAAGLEVKDKKVFNVKAKDIPMLFSTSELETELG